LPYITVPISEVFKCTVLTNQNHSYSILPPPPLLCTTDQALLENASPSLATLNVHDLTEQEKKIYDEAAVKLQKITRGVGGKRKALLKSEMKVAATEIGESAEVQVAAARLQAQYRARKDRLYVENLKKEKKILQQGVEKAMTLTIHSLARVHPHVPLVSIKSTRSQSGKSGNVAATAAEVGYLGSNHNFATSASSLQASQKMEIGSSSSSSSTPSSHTHTHHHAHNQTHKDQTYAFDNIYITAFYHPRSLLIKTDADKADTDDDDDLEDQIPTTDSEGNALSEEAIAARLLNLSKEKEKKIAKQAAIAKALEEEEEKEEWEEIWEDVEVEETKTVTRRVDHLAQAALKAGVVDKTAAAAISAFGNIKKSDAAMGVGAGAGTGANSSATNSSTETVQSHPHLYETVKITETVKHPQKVRRKRVPVPLFTSRCVSRNLVRSRGREELEDLSNISNAQTTSATGVSMDTFYWEDVFEIDLGYGKKMSDYKHVRLEVWRSPIAPVYTSNSTSIYKHIPRLDFMLFKRAVTKKCATFSHAGEIAGTPDYQKRIDQANSMILAKVCIPSFYVFGFVFWCLFIGCMSF